MLQRPRASAGGSDADAAGVLEQRSLGAPVHGAAADRGRTRAARFLRTRRRATDLHCSQLDHKQLKKTIPMLAGT